MSALSAVKASINPNHNKPPAYPAHLIIAPRILPQPQKLNVQIHVKVPPLKDINIAMPTPTAFSFQRLQTLSVNVSQDLMEQAHNAQVKAFNYFFLN